MYMSSVARQLTKSAVPANGLRCDRQPRGGRRPAKIGILIAGFSMITDAQMRSARAALGGRLPCSSGVGSRSSTWPVATSMTSLAAWEKSLGRLGGLGVITLVSFLALPCFCVCAGHGRPCRSISLHLGPCHRSSQQRDNIAPEVYAPFPHGRFASAAPSIADDSRQFRIIVMALFGHAAEYAPSG